MYKIEGRWTPQEPWTEGTARQLLDSIWTRFESDVAAEAIIAEAERTGRLDWVSTQDAGDWHTGQLRVIE